MKLRTVLGFNIERKNLKVDKAILSAGFECFPLIRNATEHGVSARESPCPFNVKNGRLALCLLPVLLDVFAADVVSHAAVSIARRETIQSGWQ